MMKVVAFNGSSRGAGNTKKLLETVLAELSKHGFITDLVDLDATSIMGCRACYECFKKKDKKCVFQDDMANDCIEKMLDADVILIGSPTYFANVSTQIKALIDRVGFVSRANNNMLKGKVGAAVVAVRRAGAINVFNSINNFFLIGEMIVVGSDYWNLGVGLAPNDVENDAEGLETMRKLGVNIATHLKNRG